jgi:hypothetical protein
MSELGRHRSAKAQARYDRPEYRLQVAAYAKARERELGVKYDCAWILRLPKDGGPVETRHCDAEGLDKAFQAFRGLLDYYKWARS